MSGHQRCTNGIDISGYFVSLRDFQQGLSSNSIPAGDSSDPYVGFVDAEGQGDRGVSYDVSLVCPLLLVVSVVTIFDRTIDDREYLALLVKLSYICIHYPVGEHRHLQLVW